mgnify:FL=1
MAFLEVNSRSVRLGEPPREVLSAISFKAEAGSTTLVLGANGSGKSVLLRSLLGLVPGRGEVRVAGRRLRGRLQWLYRRSGVSFQNPDLQIFGDTVGEDIAIALEPDTNEAEIGRLLHIFALEESAHRSPWELSGGQRRRLALATACAGSPELLVLDEPYIELDYPSIQALTGELRRLRESGSTVIVASHETRDIWPLTDQVIVLHAGQQLYAGDPLGALRFVQPEFGLRPLEGI